jgi:hypothetical protein
MYRRRGPRPLLVLQWVIIMLIVMVIFRSFGFPWFIWIFPFFVVCSWGGGWHGKRRWHRRRHHRRHHDDFDDYDEDDDADYV